MANVSRIIVLILLLPILSIAQGDGISMSVENESIDKVLLDIAAHFGKDLIFHQSYFKDQSRITVDLRNQDLNQALKSVLIDSHFKFDIKGNDIFLYKVRTLHGYVKSAYSHEALVSANVYNEDDYSGVSTNDYGYFSYTVPFEIEQIAVSYIGFEKTYVNLDLSVNYPLNIYLTPESEIDSIIILPTIEEQLLSREHSNSNLISSDINSRLSTGGEPDINQFLYSQSGVSSGPDGIGGLHVRGGNSDQNLILLDGVRVYQPNHAFGLFSIFNTALLKNARFTKFNFHPKYFDGLSSAVDMRLKEGSTNNWGGNVSFSTLASQINLDGPLIKGRTSLVLSGRLSHINRPLKTISRSNNANPDGSTEFNQYRFRDINAKISHKFGTNTTLFLSYYGGGDFYNNNYFDNFNYEFARGRDSLDFRINFGNHIAAVRLNQIYGDKLFSNSTLSYSNFNYKSISTSSSDYTYKFDGERFLSIIDYNFNSSIDEYSLKHDMEYFITPSSKLSFGLSHIMSSYQPGEFNDTYVQQYQGMDTTEQFVLTSNRYLTHNSSIYVNENIHFLKRFYLQVGGKYSHVRNIDYGADTTHVFNVFQGRLALTWRALDQLSFQLSADELAQPFHQLTGSNIGFPNDLWVPATSKIGPQRSSQLNFLVEYNPSKSLNIQLSVFQKLISNIIRYPHETSLPSLEDRFSDGWEDAVVVGNGLSNGLELDLSYRDAKNTLLTAYTWSKYDRQFDEIEDGFPFPFIFDQNHNLSFEYQRKVGENITLYSQFKFSKGIRQTLLETVFQYSPFSYFNPSNGEEVDLENGVINGDQLPNYHRLDVGVIFRYGRNNNHTMVLGIQNVYNRKNIYYRYRLVPYVDEDGNSFGTSELRNINALPMLPTLRYSYDF